jgi:hypothetical protein
MPVCLWCKSKTSKAADEHIIPESVGCPPEFVLKSGEVCEDCNNGLAHLDREVVQAWDFLLFYYNIPRKDNRPPAVDSRGNFVARQTAEGPTLFVNMDPKPIAAPHGVDLGAYGRSKRNVSATLTRDGDNAEITYNIGIKFSKKFVRGLHKIALESLAYFIDVAEALDDKYDPIRSYVLDGSSSRQALGLMSEDILFRNQVWPPYRDPDRTGYVVCIRLAVFEYVVDLTPNCSALPTLIAKQEELKKGTLMILPHNK